MRPATPSDEEWQAEFDERAAILVAEAMVERRLCEAISLPPVVGLAEAMSWLDWLDGNEAALVQARLEGARWKMICWLWH